MRGATLTPMRNAWALAGLFVLATEAAAAPIAKASLDVDGDGKTDELELDAEGTLRVNGTKRASLGNATKASFEVAKTSTGMWLVVEAGENAYVINAKTWQIAANTPLGGVGLDREYSVDVDATPDGVFRYQKRHDVRRCDGKPAYLFPERLDAKGATPNPPINVANPTALVAKIDATPAPPAPMTYQAP